MLPATALSFPALPATALLAKALLAKALLATALLATALLAPPVVDGAVCACARYGAPWLGLDGLGFEQALTTAPSTFDSFSPLSGSRAAAMGSAGFLIEAANSLGLSVGEASLVVAAL